MDILLFGLIAMAIMAIENIFTSDASRKQNKKIAFLQEEIDELNKQVKILKGHTQRLEALEEIVITQESLLSRHTEFDPKNDFILGINTTDKA